MSIIYMDHAATSWPKPPQVIASIQNAIVNAGGNPGRGSHRLAIAAGETLYETRDVVASFFNCPDPFRVTFSKNITEAINLIMRGFLRPGDHVLVSPMEHNAVMRPLIFLEKRGVSHTVLPAGSDGKILTESIPALIHPATRLMIICHESNVNGVIQPVREAGKIAEEHGIFLLVDAAQSSGSLPINMQQDAIDFLAFTGHKGLYGPTGTGGVIFGDRVNSREIEPLILGGTGSLSESFEQPEFMPDQLESGTQNVAGLAGLTAGIRWVSEQLARNPRTLDHKIIRLIDGLRQIPGVTCYTALKPEDQGSVISITIADTDNGLAGEWLDTKRNIMSRVGLHCAPAAHKQLGTFPNGTIRLSVSWMTTDKEIEMVIQAVRELAENPALI